MDYRLGTPIDGNLHTKLVEEQKRIEKLTGIEPTLNDVVRMLLQKGLDAGKKRS